MVYVTGDTHGEIQRFKTKAFRRLGAADTLIVLGDFGFLWDGGAAERENLIFLKKQPYKIFFLDGCHENYNMLATYPVQELYGGRMQHIGGSVYHVCRGSVLQLDGLTLLCMGGGESEDRENRLEQVSWWPEEMPTEADLSYCAKELAAHERRVDYILSYDGPETLLQLETLRPRRARKNVLHVFLEEVRKAAQYRHWYLGRYHLDQPLTPKATAVFGGLIALKWDTIEARETANDVKETPAAPLEEIAKTVKEVPHEAN